MFPVGTLVVPKHEGAHNKDFVPTELQAYLPCPPGLSRDKLDHHKRKAGIYYSWALY